MFHFERFFFLNHETFLHKLSHTCYKKGMMLSKWNKWLFFVSNFRNKWLLS